MKMKVDWERMHKASREACDRLEQELADLKASLPKVRADAVNYAIDEADWFSNRELASIPDMREIARKMEAGNEQAEG